MKVELWYRDEWCEVVEVEISEGATREEAERLAAKAGELHQPVGPPRSRLSPVNLVHRGWAGDPVFAGEGS